MNIDQIFDKIEQCSEIGKKYKIYIQFRIPAKYLIYQRCAIFELTDCFGVIGKRWEFNSDDTYLIFCKSLTEKSISVFHTHLHNQLIDKWLCEQIYKNDCVTQNPSDTTLEIHEINEQSI